MSVKIRQNETKVGHTGIDVHRGNRAASAVGSVGARSLKRTRIRSKGVHAHRKLRRTVSMEDSGTSPGFS